MTKYLSRRTVLRGMAAGVGATVALPAFEAMLNTHGEALASGEALPCRYGVWFWGNGTIMANWIPDQDGPDWQPKSLTQPFFDADTAVSEYVTLVSGTRCPSSGSAHHVGRAYSLAGSYDENAATYGRATSATSDQLVADELQGEAPFRSLDLGISARGFENSSNTRAMSWVDPSSPPPAEHSPSALFERLFGNGVDEGDGRLTQARASVLDVVAEDAQALRQRLGAADQARLEQHLDGVRAIEQQLEANPTTCSLPVDPGDFPDQDGQEQLEETSRAMSMLLAHALACDLTRTFTLKFTGMQTDTYFWQTGAAEGLHTMTHDGGMQDMVHDAVRFMMKELAFTLKELSEMPEGTSNVLDNCGIYCTSEVSEGYNHSTSQMPVLVCGRAGGNLSSGIHYRSNNELISRVPLTVVRACGATLTGFGAGDGYTEQTLPGIEV